MQEAMWSPLNLAGVPVLARMQGQGQQCSLWGVDIPIFLGENLAACMETLKKMCMAF